MKKLLTTLIRICMYSMWIGALLYLIVDPSFHSIHEMVVLSILLFAIEFSIYNQKMLREEINKLLKKESGE